MRWGPARPAAVFFLLSLLLLSACKKAIEPKNPYFLTEGSIGDAKRLNPLLATDGASANIASLVFNGLVKYDKNIQLVGDLAESFEVTPDCLSVGFTLRKGVKWHDGAEFTGEDVLFTYKAITDPDVVTPYKTDFEPVKRVELVDPYTVRVSYERPFSPGLASWGMGMLPKHLLQGKDFNTDPFNRAPVGTGPFRFREWVTGQKIVLDANAEYFEGKPDMQGYIYRIIPDGATMFLELQALNLDMMGLNPTRYVRQTDTPFFKKEFNRFKYPALSYTYMGYNLNDSRFSDRRVRQAIAHAIDKQAILTGVLLGLGKPATGPYIPESWAYDPSVQDIPFDPERAKVLLAEAGWKDTDGDGILDKDGRAFSFTILTNQGNEERQKTAEIIQQYLSKVGIKTEVRVLEWQSLLHNFIDKKQFEAIILGWGVGLDPDLYPIWHSSQTKEGEFNFVSYKNATVDRLLIRGRESCSFEERKKIYHEIHRLIAEDQPYLFLYYPMALPVIHKRFKGVEPSPIGITYNLPKWTIPRNRSEWYQTP
jgi:peptide/nickel transport system substrate-binding protein